MLFYTANPQMSQLKALSAHYRARVLFNSLAKPYISVKLAKTDKPAKLMEEVIDIMSESAEKEQNSERTEN